MNIVLPFKRSRLRKVLDKYTKLLNSDVFKHVTQTNNDLMELFDEEKLNCKFYEDELCKHKHGHGVCFILDCPIR